MFSFSNPHFYIFHFLLSKIAWSGSGVIFSILTFFEPKSDYCLTSIARILILLILSDVTPVDEDRPVDRLTWAMLENFKVLKLKFDQIVI